MESISQLSIVSPACLFANPNIRIDNTEVDMNLPLRKTVLASTLALLGSMNMALAAPVGFASLNGGTTGGEGGNTVTVSTGAELYQLLKDKRGDDTPLTIVVSGRITPENTGEEKIDIKDTRNVTIIGAPGGAEFDGIGIKLSRAHNIIIRNLVIHEVDTGDKDAIGIEGGSTNIWIDHNELYASLDVDKDYYDGLLDTKRGTEYVTISYNYLHDSWKASLHGSSDSDDGRRYITFHHNRWENINSRAPLFRFGEGHLFNNYYYNVVSTGINSRMGARLRIENNHFESSQNPVVSFYSDEIGYWDLQGNFLDGVYWDDDSGIVAGDAMLSTVQYQPPYAYNLDSVACVRDIVMATAGAGKGLKTSDGTCGVATPDPRPEPPTPDPQPPQPEEPEQPDQPDEPVDGGTGVNLALEAGADGSSKASGSSYGNVNDGDPGSYWQPRSDANEAVSIKRMAPFDTVVIRELNDATRSWRLVNHESGEVLASGGRLGPRTVVADLGTQDIYKLTLEILDASTPPQIAEIELYLGAPDSGGDNGNEGDGEQPPADPAETSLVLEEASTGFCNVDGVVENEHGGFTGSGYANTDNRFGTGIDWVVNAGHDGQRQLSFRFANGAADRSASLYVNGRWVMEVNLATTGDWAAYREAPAVAAYLSAGDNRISLRATNGSGLANVDHLRVSGGELSAVPCR